APSEEYVVSFVADHRAHFGFGHYFPLHLGHTLHLAHHATHLQQLQLESHLIARVHRTTPFDVVERGEIHDLLLRIGHGAHQEHPAHLRHRLDDQDTRHDRMSGEMPLKERLVDRHVLDAHDPLSRVDLDNAIDEQEWIPVRQHLHD